jgi:Lar family restriction alleviation protein
MSELKSCPFCGGEAVLETYPDPPGGTKWEEPYYVACKSCGTYKNDFPTEGDAIADWNRRICLTLSDDTVKQPCIEGPCTPDPRQLTLDELEAFVKVAMNKCTLEQSLILQPILNRIYRMRKGDRLPGGEGR